MDTRFDAADPAAGAAAAAGIDSQVAAEDPAIAPIVAQRRFTGHDRRPDAGVEGHGHQEDCAAAGTADVFAPGCGSGVIVGEF